MSNKFLQVNETKSSEAKWNMFRFHDHLLNCIVLSAEMFINRDYPSSFEALSIVYMDVYGFLNSEEQKEMDKLFNEVRKLNNKYLTYNIDYTQIQRKIKNQIYKPPLDIYFKLIDFRKKLLQLMTKYQLTIPRVKKDSAGAAEA